MIGTSDKHKAASQSIFMSSVMGLANTLAVVATFLGAPPLYGRTVGWVQVFTSHHYGTGYEDITAFLWGLVCGCLVDCFSIVIDVIDDAQGLMTV